MGGSVLRGQDGSLYFIRDEILAQTKVEGENLDHLNTILEQSSGEVEGFSFEVKSDGPVEGSIGYVQGDVVSQGGEGVAPQMVPSTIMCPW